MFRVAICDDESIYLAKEKQIIESSLDKYDVECKVDSFLSGIELIGSAGTCEYDLIMLDVEMPDLNGISVARQLRDNGINAPIAYISAHMDYSTYGYHVNAVRFILKNDMIGVYIDECIKHVLDMIDLNNRVIEIEFPIGVRQIKVNDILYLKSAGNYTEYHMYSGNELLRRKAPIKKETLMIMDYGDFVQISAGVTVNLRHVKTLCRYTVELDNGISLNVSQKKYNEVEREVILFKRGKNL